MEAIILQARSTIAIMAATTIPVSSMANGHMVLLYPSAAASGGPKTASRFSIHHLRTLEWTPVSRMRSNSWLKIGVSSESFWKPIAL